MIHLLGYESALYLGTTLSAAAIFSIIWKVVASKVYHVTIPFHYSAFSKDRKQAADIIIASHVNAAIMFGTSVYVLANEDVYTDPCWADSITVRLLACVEIGYFLVELVNLSTSKGEPWKLFMLHHTAVIMGAYVTVVYKTFAFYVCLRGLNEMSLPFMNTRWILSRMQKKGQKQYFINNLLFVVTFMVGRIAVIPILAKSFVNIVGTPQYNRVDPFCRYIFFGCTLVIDLLNIYWFVVIMKASARMLRNTCERVANKTN